MEKRFMKGCEAIAEAAVRGGCRFFAGYPITPQNEIPEYFARRMPEVGGIFLQGESEVAAINMINGAAFGGTRAMTSSSSCGISLKAEGVSQAATDHLPIVICSVMRGGPGVGPITGSQQDYWQATKAHGNGGYKLLVFTPESVQEAVDMTYHAWDYAEKYRNPVMILIDGVIGVMMEPIELPDMVSDEFLAENKAKKKAEYAVGPRNGRTEKHPLNVSDGGPMGKNHADWMKYEGWKENEVEYELYKTEDADLIISAYGISARIAKSAISILRNEGYKVGLIRPKRVYPFPVKPFAELCPDKIKGILDVEMSMPPQLLEDVAAATKGAIPIDTCLTSYGVIMNRDDIVAKAKEMLDK